jgi:hypothetical protein
MLRTIIEEPIVSETIDQQTMIYPRLQDAFDGVTWYLARDPEAGELLDDLHWLYRNQADHKKNIPMMLVIYTFDDSKVTLRFLTLRMPVID